MLVFKLGSRENEPLEVLAARRGDQIGEYFGATIAGVDLDGDSLAELLVGAPLSSQSAVPEHGTVYIFKNNGVSFLLVTYTIYLP